MFHDLDKNNEASLRKSLEDKINVNENKNSLVVIPVKELEAWLLTDVKAISTTFKFKNNPKRISNCEVIDSPKEFLRDLVWKNGKKRYLNTVHNVKIAGSINISNLKRCNSYLIFDKYLNEKLQ